MTDVIFLLLIFFMVVSTFAVPSAMEVDLPQSSEQASLKPISEIYIDSVGSYYFVANRSDSVAANRVAKTVTLPQLQASLTLIHEQDSTRPIALYADRAVDYGKVVEILSMASESDIKIVLATKAKSPQN